MLSITKACISHLGLLSGRIQSHFGRIGIAFAPYGTCTGNPGDIIVDEQCCSDYQLQRKILSSLIGYFAFRGDSSRRHTSDGMLLAFENRRSVSQPPHRVEITADFMLGSSHLKKQGGLF